MTLMYSPEAIDDILNTRKYISKKLKNPAASKRISRMIRESCKSLKEQPYIGFPVQEKIGLTCGYRCLVCESWLVFYLVDTEAVTIVRVLDGRTDYLQALFSQR